MAGLDLVGSASQGGVLRSIVESSFVFKSANVDESVEPPPVKKRKGQITDFPQAEGS